MIPFDFMLRSLLFLAITGLLLPSQHASAAAGEAVYGPMNAAEVRMRLVNWAKEQALPDTTQTAIVAAWDGASSTSIDAAAVLERAIGCWSLGLPELATFLPDCQSQDSARLAALEVHTASSGQQVAFIANNLRSYLGRVYAEQRMYDEALTQLTAVDLEQAIDPAAVLFYRAVASHEILEIPQTIAALDALLKQTDQVPPRYATIAELMQSELEGLETQSLGEVARLMHDSERRLDLGRTGERVQGVQERIVSTLDELIKKIEAQQGGGGGGSANGGNQSDAGAPDSRVKGATAPGETDDKKFKKEGRWGDLPEKQQTEAKNLINREFPSHYRQAIETYFKKLAGRPAPVDK